MSSEERRGDEVERRAPRPPFRIPVFLTPFLALPVILTLPLSVTSARRALLGPGTGWVVKISRDRPDEALSSSGLIFTLGAIMVCALLYIHDEADMRLFRRVRR